jgi:hypothetical protein
LAETTFESAVQGVEAVELVYCCLDDGVWCILEEMMIDSSRLIQLKMRLSPVEIDLAHLGTTKAMGTLRVSNQSVSQRSVEGFALTD